MNPIALSMILSSLALGTILTVSSNHWFLAWMGLEINTLAIIPLMAQNHHPRAVEASTKYFLTQAAASALLLFSALNNAWFTGEWSIMNLTNSISCTTMTIAICMKLGLAPFHFWLPEVLQGLNLTTGLILSTWQKLAPMAILYQISPSMNTSLLLLIGLTSTLIGGWGGLNQTQLRKILAFSSIAHLGWMASILPIMPQLMILNLIIYLIMTSTLFLTLKTISSTKISTLATSWPKTPTTTALTLLTLLSLGGLPPLSGFMPKWLILQELTNQNTPILATMLALSALLSLFFYLRLSYSITLTSSPNTSNSPLTWRHNSKQPTTLLSLMLISSFFLLPISPLMMS
ncbi:NADH dehydrogenase subunit 2 (mitochondrion) [Xenopus tropicalis]|uniref:NADH-ubiquinone oxidoreductase chain 2 n=1 Tax=Xenopus tropicalis TaxID=8364 RepID=Q5G7I9_XENTR|nr:NADH dehydrogenase subunit 2 [Xenopus tropicalis]AAV49099.1 NADH dehydrogenase subunit 2 [Xenopus tropicalis]QEQ13359.1 NADH dehydrogenase subunit 2 [Xenopus tropicalis]|eukprot:YP_203371.1 NADH dehydrogenase subunit 2 (mitochondrion) [Xenopus tropicalis]